MPIARASKPYQIVRKSGTNAYILDLRAELGNSTTFRVADLYPYQGTVKNYSSKASPYTSSASSSPPSSAAKAGQPYY